MEGVLAERDRVAVDAIEDTAWKDHVIARHLWKPVERDDRLGAKAELLRPERDDLAAVDVALAHEVRDVGNEALRGRAIRRHHLDARAGPLRAHVLVRSGDERDERHAVGLHEVEAELHDGKNPVVVEVEVDVVDWAHGETEAVGRGPAVNEVRQAQPPVALVLRREPDEVGAVAGLLEVRIHRDLQVRLLEALEFLGDHRHPRQLSAEMVAQALQERPFWDLRAVDDVIEEALEEKAELFG